MTVNPVWHRDQIHRTIEVVRARVGGAVARAKPWARPVLIVAGACSGEWDAAGGV